MAWTSSNEALSGQAMDDNAREVYAFFTAQGFTLNAICGMLGNMWRESTINPGVWQNYKVNYKMGFGLVQWTPATKLIDWAKQNGKDPNAGLTQCERIMWEYHNGQQYYKTSAYPLTFPQYAQSTESVEYLVKAFFANYERGDKAQAAMDKRIEWGNYYYNLLRGETPNPQTCPHMCPMCPRSQMRGGTIKESI